MKKFSLFLSLFFLLSISHSFAQQSPLSKDSYLKAEVTKVTKEGTKEVGKYKNFMQTIQVTILEEAEKGKSIQVEHGGVIKVTPLQKLSPGDQIILLKAINPQGKTTYSVMDKYRLNTVAYLIIGFFLLILLTAGKKGLGAILGMIVSLCIIMFFIVPQILLGRDPLLISICGSIAILATTIYLAHGITKKTHVAVLSTSIALAITGLLAFFFVKMVNLTGLGSEDTYLLQFGEVAINLQGLLLGGIIIGALGVLDDITTAQSALVFELKQTDPRLSFQALFQKGFTVGKEHIASLVNTLVLAYAGVSLALFILFVLNPTKQPYWVILNSEMITEEIIRTLAGSIGLVLAVPLTSAIASFFATTKLKIRFT